MPEIEKVINGLECISNGAKQPCRDCEYSKREEWCIAECAKDALALLKAQQPRVMTLEEVRLLNQDDIVWYEYKAVFRQPHPKVVHFVTDEHIITDGGIWPLSADSYGERWRLWTSRPTDEQREAEPWNS